MTKEKKHYKTDYFELTTLLLREQFSFLARLNFLVNQWSESRALPENQWGCLFPSPVFLIMHGNCKKLKGWNECSEQITELSTPKQKMIKWFYPLLTKVKAITDYSRHKNEKCTHIVMMGATESKLAIRIPISEIQAVRTKARVGSPDLEPWAKIFRNGIRLSLEIACNSRGALQRRLMR